MTNEIKNNATSIVTNAIFSAFPEAVNIREGSKNTICIPTSVVDDEGNTIYVSVNVSVKNNKATKRTEAFDFEAAKENYAAYMTEKAERPRPVLLRRIRPIAKPHSAGKRAWLYFVTSS